MKNTYIAPTSEVLSLQSESMLATSPEVGISDTTVDPTNSSTDTEQGAWSNKKSGWDNHIWDDSKE